MENAFCILMKSDNSPLSTSFVTPPCEHANCLVFCELFVNCNNAVRSPLENVNNYNKADEL